ncbi:anhydro-N-acetylmuramic acid kinase [Histidinibacterium aquaticum]|uniref:Anhydro-N-acetylmuramic acid kinase n=1 Tax=Histidinibacterium aquaticum TaxID=2613962 RepID=A0A5J5GNB2_9RHOB|nr:anhydro-N-acetylmuramic acid kinase [Histidinibacterium aquaticum]KAA9009068.1 anhydro-N-acetylmuramic acid kinase [Histidinibacterium aquaticum]
MLKGRGPVQALGAMSGTSLDGVDAAVIVTDGERIHEFGPSAYRPYSPTDRMILRAGLGLWPGEPGVAAATEVVDETHMAALEGFPAEIVGFHGQTLAHEPEGRGTHQAGDGQALADFLGIPVIWDFRSADVRLGGQGAPLAPFYHFALARWLEAKEPLAFLNLGGVGNLTWIDPRLPKPESDGALLAFDTGPANAPVDDLLWSRRGQARDENGALAREGTVREDLLDRFLSDSYFLRIPPKSLDRGAFPALAGSVAELPDADAAATLTACAAASVVAGLDHCPVPPERLLVTGGGRHNATLMEMIAAGTGIPVAPVEEVGIDGDMLEAQAFAHLAVRVIRGLPTSAPGTTGVAAAVGGGVLSRPEARPASLSTG